MCATQQIAHYKLSIETTVIFLHVNQVGLPLKIGITIILFLSGLSIISTITHAAPTATKPVPTAQPVQRVVRPRAPTDIRKVAVGPAYMLGVLQNDTLISWGDNRHWQSTIPYRYKDTQFTDVAAGLNVAYALDTTGAVVAWG